MDLLNRALVQLNELFKRMTPGARLAAIGSLVMVVVSAAWLTNRPAPGPDAYLMGGEAFSAAQLRDMESAFGKAGLEDYQIDGARVRVPSGHQSKYMASLADEGALPEDFGEHLRKAVNSSGFMLDGSRQEAQTKVAIQSELQLVISRMQGIEKAFVHIAEETSGFPPIKTVTASVGVQPRNDQAIDDATVAAIRSFVASAWGGLKSEAVTVVDLSGNRLFAGPPEGGAKGRGPADNYASYKKQLELDWQDKVTRALKISGALVTANVEPDPAGRRPPRVSICVAVPPTYYEEIWRRRGGASAGAATRPPDPAALAAIQQAETRKIQEAIMPLLGPADPRVDRHSQITVSTIYSSAGPTVAEPVPADPVLAWFGQNWQVVGIGGLIVAGLLMLRSTIKSVPAPVASGAACVELQNSLLLVSEDEPAPAAMASMPARSAVAPTESLRGELTDMVRQHPQAAVSVLRNWIGNAS